jgi:hypothetical protein
LASSVSQAELEGIRLSSFILRGFTFKYDHEFGYFRTRRSYSWKVPKRHDSTYAPIFLCLGVRDGLNVIRLSSYRFVFSHFRLPSLQSRIVAGDALGVVDYQTKSASAAWP